MRQNRLALSWIFVLAAAVAFAAAVGSAAMGNVRGFWLGFAAGLALTVAGLSTRRRAALRGAHSEHLTERGLLEDESDLALTEKPRPIRHYSGDDDVRPDLEDRRRP